MFNSLLPHGLQHAEVLCSPWFSGVCSNSCPLNQWCYVTISSSVVPFSSCLQSLPASRSLPMSLLFTSRGQSIGASASASVPIHCILRGRVYPLCLSLGPIWQENYGLHPRKFHSTCSQTNNGLNLEPHKVSRMSFTLRMIIWTKSKPSCLKTQLLLIIAPLHCWSVTWLFSFCLGNDLVPISWIV